MKKILTSMLFIILSVTCMGCSLSSADSGEKVEIENPRTETDTLKDWFPNMQGIESAEWELVTVTTQGRMPGPSDYQIKGIIVLDEDVAEKYLNQYEWTEVAVDFDTEYADLSEYEDVTWYRSMEMTEDMLSAGKIGDIYFSGKYIWFQVMTS